MKAWAYGSLLILTALAIRSAAECRAAEMQYPLSVVADEKGVVYVADRTLPGIWKIVDGKAEVFFQASKKFRTPLNAVRCVALDEKGRLLAGDSATRDVYRFDESGKPQPLTGGHIGIPMAITVGPDGTLFVADLETHRIWKVASEGGEPVELTAVPAPRGLTIDAENRLWVVSHGPDHLLRVWPDGRVETIVKGRVFEFAHNVVLDEKQTAYVSDGYAKAIWKVSPNGEAAKWVSGDPLRNPVGLAWRGKNLLVADPRAKAIFSITPEGRVMRLAGSSDDR